MADKVYDESNIFAKIIKGDIPCHKVYEDDNVLSFMDIMPRVDGHCLVIPKANVRNILDCPDDVLQNLIINTKKIGQAAVKAFNADGLTVQQFSEAAGGQEVFHIHFHVMPRVEGVQFRDRAIADNELLAKHAEMIKANL